MSSIYSTFKECYDFERERLLLQRQEEEERSAVAVNDYLFEEDDNGDANAERNDEGSNRLSNDNNGEGVGETEENAIDKRLKSQLLLLIE